MERIFVILIYTLAASRLLLDVWGVYGGTKIDIYGRIALSFLIICVLSPLISFVIVSFLQKVFTLVKSQLPN